MSSANGEPANTQKSPVTGPPGNTESSPAPQVPGPGETSAAPNLFVLLTAAFSPLYHHLSTLRLAPFPPLHQHRARSSTWECLWRFRCSHAVRAVIRNPLQLSQEAGSAPELSHGTED
ncbi:hypothetical protein EJ08DRAFT_700346 [Tothia fuscella]|uniref:Uncharacterized protein n=1 Tax=Tothia fuscella TaxID=1048955 RepID=A0A9P4NL80_9PEZI|nr:hypothetical protein EJ08DRAFT_700346 [Tothia fuscella]